MTIYVGNLSYKVSEDELKEVFAEYGDVSSVRIIKDHATGQSRGFAFVEMGSKEEANQAIEELNEAEYYGKTMLVREAKPKTNDSRGGQGGGGGFNRGGGGGGGDRNRGGGGREGGYNRGGGEGGYNRGGNSGGGGGGRRY